MSGNQFTIRVMPVGAEVCGLPERNDYSDMAAELYEAWLQHGVLVFRGVNSVEQHLALSRCFGELEPHPMVDQRSKEHPLMLELGGRTRKVRAMVFDETDVYLNRVGWHRDTAYTPDICKGAMLRLIELPKRDGQTMFADTSRAYDDLPQAMKDRLASLEYRTKLQTQPTNEKRLGAFWQTARWATTDEDAEGPPIMADSGQLEARYPAVIHPALLVHPETGRKGLFLSPKDFDCFLGMDRAESDALMDELVDHALQPKYVYKHEWRHNEALLWDNRRFMHAAVGNPLDDWRWGLRTTLAGPVRTGRYADPGITSAAAPAMMD